MSTTTNREKDSIFTHQKFENSSICALCLGDEGWPCKGRQIEELLARNADLLAALEGLADEFESRMDGIEAWTESEARALRSARAAIAQGQAS